MKGSCATGHGDGGGLQLRRRVPARVSKFFRFKLLHHAEHRHSKGVFFNPVIVFRLYPRQNVIVSFTSFSECFRYEKDDKALYYSGVHDPVTVTEHRDYAPSRCSFLGVKCSLGRAFWNSLRSQCGILLSAKKTRPVRTRARPARGDS